MNSCAVYTCEQLEKLKEYCTTDKELQCIDLIIAHNCIVAEAAKNSGINTRNFYRRFAEIKKRAAKRHFSPENGINNPLPETHLSSGVSQLIDERTGSPVLTWYKSKPEKENEVELMRQMMEAFCEDIPKHKPVKAPRYKRTGLLNDIIIGDPHLDMLAYDKETGANWDIKISEERHTKGVMALLERAPKADKSMLTILGDTLHRDSLKALTPGSGNLVDVDGRLSRSLDVAVRLFRRMIDRMLVSHKEVIVNFIRGNHSESLELCLRKMLNIAYERNKRVTVLDNTCKHIPYTFGKNFLLSTHGDKLNDQKKADIATTMFKKEHGNAKFTHVRCGHVHHTSQKEISGSLVETFQALPTPDAWHTEAGYVTSDQSISLITYHEAGGIVSRLTEYPRIFL